VTTAATLAVDLGGTNMRVAAVADDGTMLDRDHEPTPHDADTIDPFLELVERLREHHQVTHAVVAVPGRVDHVSGELLHAPNLPPKWFTQINRTTLEAALGVRVTLANDADVAAVGEAYFGAGRGHDDVLYVTVSTGVGAGLVTNGRVLLPRRSGGEVGHTVIDRHAALAGDERRGRSSPEEGPLAAPTRGDGEPATVEGLGSGTALARMAAERGLGVKGAELVARVQAGDAQARAAWDDAMSAVGIGVVNLVHVLAPTIVVMGGGVGRNGDLVLQPVRDAIARFGPMGTPPDVVTAALGDDPGLIGAAAWQRATMSS
jgi:glucokinase